MTNALYLYSEMSFLDVRNEEEVWWKVVKILDSYLSYQLGIYSILNTSYSLKM